MIPIDKIDAWERMENGDRSKLERSRSYISGNYGTQSARVLLGRRIMEQLWATTMIDWRMLHT